MEVDSNQIDFCQTCFIPKNNEVTWYFIAYPIVNGKTYENFPETLFYYLEAQGIRMINILIMSQKFYFQMSSSKELFEGFKLISGLDNSHLSEFGIFIGEIMKIDGLALEILKMERREKLKPWVWFLLSLMIRYEEWRECQHSRDIGSSFMRVNVSGLAREQLKKVEIKWNDVITAGLMLIYNHVSIECSQAQTQTQTHFGIRMFNFLEELSPMIEDLNVRVPVKKKAFELVDKGCYKDFEKFFIENKRVFNWGRLNHEGMNILEYAACKAIWEVTGSKLAIHGFLAKELPKIEKKRLDRIELNEYFSGRESK